MGIDELNARAREATVTQAEAPTAFFASSG